MEFLSQPDPMLYKFVNNSVSAKITCFNKFSVGVELVKDAVSFLW